MNKMKVALGKCVGAKFMWFFLIIGGLNWGLIGAFDYDLVDALFGAWTWLVDLVYILVGLSALVLLVGGCKCAMCKKKGKKDGCCGGGACGPKGSDMGGDKPSA